MVCMKRKALPALLALLLCLALSACWVPGLPGALPGLFGREDSPGGASSGSPEDETAGSQRNFIHYSEMRYERPDLAALQDSFAALTQQIAGAASFDELWALDEQATELYDHFATMYTLAELGYYNDTTSTYYQEEKAFCADAAVALGTAVNDLNTAIVHSPYAEEYRQKVGDYVYEALLAGLLSHSEEVEDLRRQRTGLEQEYDNMMASLTVSLQGESYNYEAISRLEGITYVLLVNQFFETHSGAFADLYIEMIELDKAIAATLGFESPEEMYYLIYSRDYTPAEALALCETVREEFGPLTPAIFGAGYSNLPMDYGETMRRVPDFLRQVDPELEDAWDDMLEYGLYDFASSPQKQRDIAFTTTIDDYGAPFIFMNWQGDFRSAETLVHEFGHFYDNWLRSGETTVFNLDIVEIYSQGLEFLWYDKLGPFTDDEAAARQLMLYYAANAIVFQSLLEEFQFRAYGAESLDRDTLAQIYTDLQAEYGLGGGAVADENGLDHSWFRVKHFFRSPFYTISYVTSNVVAMQLWADAQQDWDAAAQRYLALIRADQNQPFGSLIEQAGFTSPFEASSVGTIAGYYREAYALPQAA